MNANRTATRHLWWAVFCLVLLIAGLVETTLAQHSRRCPPCTSLRGLAQNFDDLTPPALPAVWLATNALGPPPLWVTSNNGVPSPPADTPPNAAFIDDPAVVSDKRLDSIEFSFFEQLGPQLTFRHNCNLEASPTDPNVGFDGGVLEISTDGGNTFQDILAAGGSFVREAITAQLALIVAAPLPVVRRGAATRTALSRPS